MLKLGWTVLPDLELQQFYLILKCLFPDLGCPLSGRGSSKAFLPACTCCSAPSCPSSPHRSAEPALWPLTHCKLKSILPAPAGPRDARRLIRTRPAAIPGAPGILLLRVPAHVPLAPSDITLIPSWKTILMSLQRGRRGSWTRGAVL